MLRTQKGRYKLFLKKLRCIFKKTFKTWSFVEANIYPLSMKKYKRCHCSKSCHWTLITYNVYSQFKKNPHRYNYSITIYTVESFKLVGGSIFVISVGSFPSWICILDEKLILLKLKPTHSGNCILTNNQFFMFVKLICYKQNQQLISH